MKIFWTILMTLLLASLPAARIFGSEREQQDTNAPCAKCCCCVQPQNTSAPAQHVPLSAPTRTVSAERLTPVVDKTVALPPRFSARVDSVRERILLSSVAAEPLFERLCALLI